MANGTYYIDTNVNPGSSTIQVGSGCDIAHQKLQAEIDEEIARATAREDEIESKIEKNRVFYFNIPSPEGEFPEDIFTLLLKNNLNQLVYQNDYYKLAYKDTHIRRYATEILFEGYNQMIVVDVDNHTWRYEILGNPILTEHIRDKKIHITQAERDSWNNKVTCFRRNETLIFTKN